MTTATDTDDAQLALEIPGLTQPNGQPSSLEAAVRVTLGELHSQGHIQTVDAGKAALAVELAQVIFTKRKTGRASTIGNDARVLMEILDSFVEEATDVDDDLREALERWGEVERVDAPAPESSA